MNRLLHLNASPRAARSRSLAVAEALVARLAEALPGLAVRRLDLFDEPLPRFDGAAVEGRYRLIRGLPVLPHEETAWQAVRQAAAFALSHDIWLISTPMWNFGLPFPLKQWIDAVTHPGLLFEVRADGSVRGLASAQRLIVVAASAMPFATDGTLSSLDFQLPYLRAWAGFVGITRIDDIRVAPTHGSEAAVSEAMAAGHAAAMALAGRLIAQARGDARD